MEKITPLPSASELDTLSRGFHLILENKRSARSLKALNIMAQMICTVPLKGGDIIYGPTLAESLRHASKQYTTKVMAHIAEQLLSLTHSRWNLGLLARAISVMSHFSGTTIDDFKEKLMTAADSKDLDDPGTKPQDLSMLFSGSSWSDIDAARTIQKKVLDEVLDQDFTFKSWPNQSIMTLAIGLGRVLDRLQYQSSDYYHLALDKIARHMTQKGFLYRARWNVLQLISTGTALRKSAGKDIDAAVAMINEELARKEISSMNAVELANISSWFQDVTLRGERHYTFLKAVAEKLSAKDLSQLSLGQLALTAHGMTELLTYSSRQIIRDISKEVYSRAKSGRLFESKDDHADHLYKLISAFSITGHEQICLYLINNHVLSQPPANISLSVVFGSLCHLSLDQNQVVLGINLLKRMKQEHYIPSDTVRKQLLLSDITMLHFASTRNARGCSKEIEGLYHYWKDLSLPSELSSRYQYRWQVMDHWKETFTTIYWSSHPNEVSSIGIKPNTSGNLSDDQTAVYESLKGRLHFSNIEWEKTIKDYSVDILVDGKVCVEVDGPRHYIKPLCDQIKVIEADLSDDHYQDNWTRLTPRIKNRFVDHVLEKLGYKVFRVSYKVKNYNHFIDGVENYLTELEAETGRFNKRRHRR